MLDSGQEYARLFAADPGSDLKAMNMRRTPSAIPVPQMLMIKNMVKLGEPDLASFAVSTAAILFFREIVCSDRIAAWEAVVFNTSKRSRASLRMRSNC